jgi:hypothetical protein
VKRQHNHLWTAVAIVTGAAATLLLTLALAKPAACFNCLPTFCGNDSECPGSCRCYIPNGKATGHCN